MPGNDKSNNINNVTGEKVVIVDDLKGDININITNKIAISTAIDFLDIIKQESGEAKKAFLLKYLEDCQYNPSINSKKQQEAVKLYEEFKSLTPKQMEDMFTYPEKHLSLKIKFGIFIAGIAAGLTVKEIWNNYIVKSESDEYEEVEYQDDEVDLTEEQLQQYYAAYEDPYVIHIRKALNAYLSGNFGSPFLGSGYLDSFSKEYYKSKFVVLSIEGNMWGGKNIHIMFQDKPDKIFVAWVYRLADGDEYDLRGFWEHEIDPDSLNEHNIMFKRFLDDKEHAL